VVKPHVEITRQEKMGRTKRSDAEGRWAVVHVANLSMAQVLADKEDQSRKKKER
jgi:hypothetical protein